MNQRFFRNQHLRLACEFARFEEGSVYKSVTEFFVLKAIPNGLPFSRIGIITSKRVGCAVKRNWARRVIREIFRTCIQAKFGTCDLLVIVRQGMVGSKFSVIRDEFLSSMERYSRSSFSCKAQMK